MSHAPGLSGTPDSGHRSSAATSASCARSSARPMSRTIRVSPAMSLADSILQTASIARCVSGAVMATDQIIFHLSVQDRGAPRLLLLRELLPEPSVVFDRLAGPEVFELEHLANLDLALTVRHGIGAALDPFDCLLLGLHLNQPEAGDQLLRLGEGPVDHGAFVSREL